MSKRSSGTKVREAKLSTIEWIVMGFTFLFLLIAPYSKGLFNGYTYSFEQPIYIAALSSALVLFLIGAYKFRSIRLETHRDLLTLLIWLIPITYVFSMFNAVISHQSIVDLYIRIMWVVFFLVGAYFTQSNRGLRIINYILIGSGYWITLYGLMIWFGNVTFQDALLQGNRLSNVFQYPNTYAAYLVALIVMTLIVMNTSKSKYKLLVAGLFLVPLIISLMLTLSRGAIVVFSVVLILYLVCIPWYRQVQTLAYLAVASIGSIAIFSPMQTVRREIANGSSSSLLGWFLLIAISIMVAVINYLITIYVNKRMRTETKSEKYFNKKNLILPLTLVITGIIVGLLLMSNSGLHRLLPGQLQERFENMSLESSSIISRNTFYQDSLQLIQDYPIVGAGGGAWSVLYNAYKSYAYTSNQAHNFPLQYIIETGIVGFIALFIILVYSFFLFIKNMIQEIKKKQWNQRRLIAPILGLTLLLHSILDFDMSYVYFSAIVFLCVGASISKDVTSLKKLKFQQFSGKSSMIVSSVIIVGAATLLFFASQSIRADANLKEAIKIANTTGNYNELNKSLDRALELAPKHWQYGLVKVDFLRQIYLQTNDLRYLDEATEVIEQVKKYNKYSTEVILREYSILMDKDQIEEANILINEERVKRHPWEIIYYDHAAESYYQLAKRSEAKGNVKQRDQYWDNALEVLDTVVEKRQYLDALSYSERYESRDFKLTPSVGLTSGMIYYQRQQYAEASDIIGKILSDDFDDSVNREAMRWFLASLKKQGKWHEVFYNQLIAKVPEEAMKIEKLVNSQE